MSLNECSTMISINKISKEDFYNRLYWDHRIYDIRCLEEYNISHICRSHHIDCSSIEKIFQMDNIIDQDYGKPENPSTVLIYSDNNDDVNENCLLISYLKSSKNLLNKNLKEIQILIDGFQNFN